MFRDWHLLFEEHGAEVLASIDELAERSLMLDGQPIADPAEYLTKAIAAHEVVIQELHADAAAVGEDIGTADLFTRLVQVHQKQRWFLREVLRKGDGLLS